MDFEKLREIIVEFGRDMGGYDVDLVDDVVRSIIALAAEPGTDRKDES